MRDLTEVEENKVHGKLSKFIGQNLEELLVSSHLIQLHNQKVLFIPKELKRHTSQISREKLVCAGTTIGKFTKSNNFRVHVTSIHLLEGLSPYKIWIKSSAEMNFLYGKNVLRSHMHKVSDNVVKNNVVFVYNQNNTVLGFGVATKSTSDIINSKGNTLIVVNQVDTGMYLRAESSM